MSNIYTNAKQLHESLLRFKFPKEPSELGIIAMVNVDIDIRTNYVGNYIPLIKSICLYYNVMLLGDPASIRMDYKIIGRSNAVDVCKTHITNTIDRIEWAVRGVRRTTHNSGKHMLKVKNEKRVLFTNAFVTKVKLAVGKSRKPSAWVFEKVLYKEFKDGTYSLQNKKILVLDGRK